jgi:hypothetical protein
MFMRYSGRMGISKTAKKSREEKGNAETPESTETSGDLLLWDVGVVARAYAHGVMPCQGKSPPD